MRVINLLPKPKETFFLSSCFPDGDVGESHSMPSPSSKVRACNFSVTKCYSWDLVLTFCKPSQSPSECLPLPTTASEHFSLVLCGPYEGLKCIGIEDYVWLSIQLLPSASLTVQASLGACECFCQEVSLPMKTLTGWLSCDEGVTTVVGWGLCCTYVASSPPVPRHESPGSSV